MTNCLNKCRRRLAAMFLAVFFTSLLPVQDIALAYVAAPSLVSPANAASITKGSDIFFDWSDVSGATYHEIWIDNNSGFGSPEVGFNNGASAQWVNNGITAGNASNWFLTVAMQNVLPQNTYFWKVRALDSAKNQYSDWSAVQQFNLMNDTALPGPPVLLTPANGTSYPSLQNVNFSWNPVQGGQYYQVKVATDSAMSNVVPAGDGASITATSLNVNSSYFQAGKTYYWQVSAMVNSVWGPYSPVTPWSFSFAAPAPTKVTVTGPAASVTTKEITFSWNAVPNAVRYELYVDNNSGLGSAEISKNNIAALQNLTATTYTMSDYWLEPGNTHYWKVYAVFANNSTISSDLMSFTYYPPRVAVPVWVPLYRLYKSSIKDHFYTTSPTQRDQAITASGYVYEREEGLVSDRPTTDFNLVPMYHLYSSSVNNHLYTIDGVTRDNKILAGYIYQGISAFVSKVSGTGLVSFYYTENVTNTDNFYTTSQFERDNSISSFAFTDRGTAGYVKYLSPTNLEQAGVESRPQANMGGVDLGSGAYRGLNSLDLGMEGRGPSLGFSHHYNSFNLNNYPLGEGWSHNLNSFVYEATEGGVSKVFVFWGDGSMSEFQKSGVVYNDVTGNHDALTLVNDGVNYGYDLKSKDQTVYAFRKIGGEVGYRIMLIKITDWRGDSLSFSYDAAYARLLEVADGFSRKLVFTYSLTGQLTKVQEFISGAPKRSVSFAYDSNGLLTSFTDVRGQVTSFSYYTDDVKKDLVKTITYPKLNTVTIDYDTLKRAASIQKGTVNPAATITYSTDAAGITTTTFKDPLNVVNQARHNILSQVTAGRAGQGAADVWTTVERTNVDNPNLVTKATDAEGRVTRFAYDAMGNLTSVINANGNPVTYTYNDKNNILTATDFYLSGTSPAMTTYTYDTNNNRLRKITNPAGEVINLNYDEGLAGGKSVLTSVVDGALNKLTFEYDTYGNLVKTTNPEGKITQAVRDEWGRIKDYIDPENIKISFEYDTGNNLTHIKYFSRALALLFNVGGVYDANGNLDNLNWVNEGLSAITQYAYDNLDRLISSTNPVSDKYSFTYNVDGSVATKVSPKGDTTSYQYDTYGRMNKVVYPDAAQNSEVLTRDKNGNVLSLKGLNGISYFEYDALYNLKKYTDPYGKVVQYVYDVANRLISITYPDGKVVNYSYDIAGRLKTVSGAWFKTTTYVYDSLGRLSEVQKGNGTKTKYTYDKAGNVLTVQELLGSGTAIASYTYTLDNVGSRKTVNTIAEPLGGSLIASNVTYGYDSKSNRLLTAGASSFTYDKNGNRLTRLNGGVTANYTWDYENRLTKVTYPYLQEFKYDELGNRIYKNDNGTVRKYVMDIKGMGNVLSEVDGTSGATVANYVYGLGLVERVDATGKEHFYHYNGRGDTVALSDATGVVTDKYAYDEFGKVLNSSGTTPNPFKFSGAYGVMDDGQGLYYLRARYYDPEVGRFISEDPLNFDGGSWNLYAYAGNNPVNAVDPGGMGPIGFGLNFACVGAMAGCMAHEYGSALGYMSVGDNKGEAESYNNFRSCGLVALQCSVGMLMSMNGGSGAGFSKAVTTKTTTASGKTVEIVGNGKSTYTVSSKAIGNGAHKAFKILGQDASWGRFKEYRIGGKSIDYIDFVTRTITEYKPYNPRSIAAGIKQLGVYDELITAKFGGEWKLVLELY